MMIKIYQHSTTAQTLGLKTAVNVKPLQNKFCLHYCFLKAIQSEILLIWLQKPNNLSVESYLCFFFKHRTTRCSAFTSTSWRLATPRISLKSSLESPTIWMLLWNVLTQSAPTTPLSSSKVNKSFHWLWENCGYYSYETKNIFHYFQKKSYPRKNFKTRVFFSPEGDEIYHYDLKSKAVEEKEFKSMPNCTSAFRFMEHYYCFHGHMFSKFDPKTGEVHGKYPKEARDYFMRCSKFSKLKSKVSNVIRYDFKFDTAVDLNTASVLSMFRDCNFLDQSYVLYF